MSFYQPIFRSSPISTHYISVFIGMYEIVVCPAYLLFDCCARKETRRERERERKVIQNIEGKKRKRVWQHIPIDQSSASGMLCWWWWCASRKSKDEFKLTVICDDDLGHRMVRMICHHHRIYRIIKQNIVHEKLYNTTMTSSCVLFKTLSIVLYRHVSI